MRHNVWKEVRGAAESSGGPPLPAPQMRCFDVNQLSMKFDRHLDSGSAQGGT